MSRTMRDVIRVVLVDPNEESRDALRRLLAGIGAIWVVEVFDTYQDLVTRIGTIDPDMTIVTLDHDAHAAIELIRS